MNSGALEILEIDISDWCITQSLVFDWYDGPKHGVCVLENLSMEVEYKCVAERYNPDGCDHRIFSISEIERGSVARLSRIMGSDKENTNFAIDEMMSKSRRARLFVYSFNFVTLLRGWRSNKCLDDPEMLLDRMGIGATGCE